MLIVERKNIVQCVMKQHAHRFENNVPLTVSELGLNIYIMVIAGKRFKEI